MLLQDRLVRLRIQTGADVTDHVAGGVTRDRIKNVGIRRVGEVIQKPHGVAVEQFVDGDAVDIRPPLQFAGAQND